MAGAFGDSADMKRLRKHSIELRLWVAQRCSAAVSKQPHELV